MFYRIYIIKISFKENIRKQKKSLNKDLSICFLIRLKEKHT